MPPDIRDEVCLASLLLPLAFTNMRWPVSNEVYISDATESSDAYLAAGVSTHLSTALYDMSIIRGVSVPLGSTDENSVNVDPGFVASPLVREVVESVPWHTYSSRKFPGIKHVNIREL